MSKIRRSHGSTFKTKVAVAAIKEELTQAQITSRFGIHTTQLRQWKNQALASIQEGFSKKHARDTVDQAELVTHLYEQMGRLQTELTWLKKNLGLTIEQKRQVVIQAEPTLTLARRLELIGLSRSTYYYQAKKTDAKTEHLLRLLDAHYTAHPHEGKIKRAQWLSEQVGYTVGKKRVARLMRHMGVETLYFRHSLPN